MDAARGAVTLGWDPPAYPCGQPSVGMATIVYDGPDEMARREVDDDELHYREGHWQITLGDDDFLYIPRDRVYSVRMHDPHIVFD